MRQGVFNEDETESILFEGGDKVSAGFDANEIASHPFDR
jgi:hypothetical protein